MFKPNLQTGLGLSYAYNHTLILVAAHSYVLVLFTVLCNRNVFQLRHALNGSELYAKSERPDQLTCPG